MAAPHVAGALALVAERPPWLRKHPGALIARVKAHGQRQRPQPHAGAVGDRHLAG